MGNILIKRAETQLEIDQVRKLFIEYREFLGEHLGFQKFERELAALPGEYSRPEGELLIALEGDRAVGCVAVRRFDQNICEMKRLFVRAEARGEGTGRKLAERIIEEAGDIGYELMRLDTLDRLTEAMILYRSLGFRRIDPYYQNPLSGVVYWELSLKKR